MFRQLFVFFAIILASTLAFAPSGSRVSNSAIGATAKPKPAAKSAAKTKAPAVSAPKSFLPEVYIYIYFFKLFF